MFPQVKLSCTVRHSFSLLRRKTFLEQLQIVSNHEYGLTFDVRSSFSSTFLSSKYCRNMFTATLVTFLVLSLFFVQLDN